MDKIPGWTLGREFNPFIHKTHKWVILIAFIGFLFSQLFFKLQDYSLADNLQASLGVSISMIVTWVLTRELDPDHNLSGFAGMCLSFIPLLIWPGQFLLTSLLLILMLRYMTKISGKESHTFDAMSIIFLTLVVSYNTNGWLTASLIAIGFFIDLYTSSKNRKHSIVGLACSMFIAGIALSYHCVCGLNFETEILHIAIAGIVTALFLAAGFETSKLVVSTTDNQNTIINNVQIFATNIYTVVFVLLYFFLYQNQSFVMLMPMWFAMCGITINKILEIGFKFLIKASR